MKTTFLDRTRYLLLILLVVLITVSSHPTIVAMSHAAGLESGTILSRYIILVFGALFLTCFNFKSVFISRFLRACWVMYFVVAFFFLITLAFFGSKSMMSDVRFIAISLVAIVIGWQLMLDEKKSNRLLLIYAGMTLFIGLMQVMTNIGGFTILDQYHTDNKNALGVMLSTSTVIFLLIGINRNDKGLWKTLCLALAILTVVVLLTIRARTSTLATIIMVMYILYERNKKRNFILFLLIGIVLVIAIFLVLPQSAKEYVYNSFFQNYEGGDVTTGRTERNLFGLHFLADHLFWGNLDQNIRVDTIHNYLLYRTFELGIIFVFPLFILYFYILFYGIKRTISTDNRNNNNMGYYLLLIPFIISLAEYTFPYGPGTATVFNFILFGMSLRYSNESEMKKSSNKMQSLKYSGYK